MTRPNGGSCAIERAWVGSSNRIRFANSWCRGVCRGVCGPKSAGWLERCEADWCAWETAQRTFENVGRQRKHSQGRTEQNKPCAHHMGIEFGVLSGQRSRLGAFGGRQCGVRGRSIPSNCGRWFDDIDKRDGTNRDSRPFVLFTLLG